MNKESPLLIYNLFIATPNAKEARSAFLEYIVEFVLFNSEVSLTFDELINKVNSFFPNPISSELIKTTLKNVATYEENPVGEIKYSLTKERKDTFRLAVNKYKQNRDAFYHKLISKVQENISKELIPIEKRKLCEATERLITTIFSDKYNLLEQAFNKDGFDICKLEEKEYDNLLKNEIKKVFPKNCEIEKIEFGVVKALKQLDDNEKKYVASIFNKIFAFFYLNQEPNELQEEKKLLKRRKLYLDANVVLGLIFPSNGRQKEITPLINQCKKLEIKLLITPNTLKEIEEQFVFAEKIFKENGGLNSKIRSGYLGHHSQVIVILDDYYNEKIENKSLEWNVYIQAFKPIREYLFKSFCIKLETERWPKIDFENATEINSISNAIKDTKKGHRRGISEERIIRPESLTCDSQNIYFVHQLRKNFQTDDMGIRIWHLTYDKSLVKSEKFVHQLFNTPACMTVPQLADFLIPFSTTMMEEFSHDQFVASLLSADFGAIVEDEDYVDIDFYANISNSGLPLEQILNLTDDRFTHRILVLFQENKKARKLAEEAGKTEDSEKKAIIKDELQKELMEVSTEPKFEETIKNLMAKIDKLELEKIPPIKKEATFFGKILAMLKDKLILCTRIVFDVSILIFLNYGVIWVYAKFDPHNYLMEILKLLSHVVIVLLVGFDAFREIKRAWKEAKE